VSAHSNNAGRLAIGAVLDASPLMAVVVIGDAKGAPDLARALLRGGVASIEVTLRTPAALEAIRRIAGEVPDVLVGAGTVLTPKDLHASAEAGARFAVSPGATGALLDAGRDGPIPYLPAVATGSEIMEGLARGYSAFKLFPASVIGGPAALRAFAGPFPEVRFCPTGGITAATAPEYLALDNVACIGGSWLTPADLLKSSDWASVERLSRESMAKLLKP
jgi:2-dehydro-3-deoxyphosphogluconate aldolase/(4S)-4-hydroxy-2-oxoglutarate aldolase